MVKDEVIEELTKKIQNCIKKKSFDDLDTSKKYDQEKLIAYIDRLIEKDGSVKLENISLFVVLLGFVTEQPKKHPMSYYWQKAKDGCGKLFGFSVEEGNQEVSCKR